MGVSVIVCVKRVMNTRVPLEIVPGSNLVVQGEPQPVFILDPAARCALEEAMGLKQRLGAVVTAITVGPASAEEVLRICLARGADRAIHILCPQEMAMDPWGTTVVLSQEIKKQRYDLLLCGDKSLDDCGGQVGPALAELLGLPQVTRVIALEVQTEHKRLVAQRLLERGDREIVECTLPALISVTALANEPRYVSVHRRLRVRDELVERFDVRSLGVSSEPLCRTIAVDWPRPRPKKIAMPASSMSAAERMRFLMSGVQTNKQGGLFEGSVEGAVDRLIEFLQDRGIL